MAQNRCENCTPTGIKMHKFGVKKHGVRMYTGIMCNAVNQKVDWREKKHFSVDKRKKSFFVRQA